MRHFTEHLVESMKPGTLAVCFLLTTIACSDSVGAKVDPAIGGYMLTAVNGQPLPAPVQASGNITSSTAIDGSIFLDRDGTYTAIAEFRIVRGTVATIELYGVPDGIWQRRSDTELQLLPKSGSETTVRVLTAGATLNVLSQGLQYQYTRR